MVRGIPPWPGLPVLEGVPINMGAGSRGGVVGISTVSFSANEGSMEFPFLELTGSVNDSGGSGAVTFGSGRSLLGLCLGSGEATRGGA